MGAGRTVILAAGVAAGAAAAGVAIGVALIWIACELDDGRHDIFGPQLPADIYWIQAHQQVGIHPSAAATAAVRWRSVKPAQPE